MQESNEVLFDVLKLRGHQSHRLRLVEFGDQVVLQLVMVEDAENERDSCDQNPLQTTHIGQNVEDRVASPLNQRLVKVHLDLDSLEKLILKIRYPISSLKPKHS